MHTNDFKNCKNACCHHQGAGLHSLALDHPNPEACRDVPVTPTGLEVLPVVRFLKAYLKT